MASLTDVARAAGVSLTTASMVLNQGKDAGRISAKRAEHVRAVARKVGYVPNYHAQSMKLGRADMIAVALDLGNPAEEDTIVPALTNPYFAHLIGSVESTARVAGVQMTIVGPDKKSRAPDRGLRGMMQRRFDGMILPGTIVWEQKTDFLRTAPRLPIVVLEYFGQTHLPVVNFDDSLAVRLAVDHLVDLGHRDLVWIYPDTDYGGGSRRTKLFFAHAAARGVHARECGVRFSGDHWQRHRENELDQMQAGVNAYFRAAGDRRPTAVVAYNDITGIAVCAAMRELGIDVPGEVSVVGCDDIDAAVCIPRLTTVTHELHAMGELAAKRLLEMVDDPAAIDRYFGMTTVIAPKLVVRASTTRPTPRR